MSSSRVFLSPVLGGGSIPHDSDPPTPYDEVQHWSVSILFRLADQDEAPVDDEARRFRMLRSLSGLSPMLTINHDAIALTISAIGTRDQAVARGTESAWTCLDAGQIRSAEMVGMNLISNERVDRCVSDGLPFLYDEETEQGIQYDAALGSIREVVHAGAFHDESDDPPAPTDTEEVQHRVDAQEHPRSEPRCGVVDVQPICDALAAPLHAEFTAHLYDTLNDRAACSSRKVFSQVVLNLVSKFVIGTDGVVNQKGAASILNVSKQRAHQILNSDAAPSPLVHLDGNPLWLRAQIERLRDQRK